MKTIKRIFTTIYEIAKALMLTAINVAVIDDIIDDGIEDIFFESVTTNAVMVAALIILMIGGWAKVFIAARKKDGE